MKKIIVLTIVLLSFNYVKGQTKDTLRNLPENSTLEIHEYTNSSQWGYWTGHNYLGRQQFCEKYYISGSTQVTGVISHLTGTVKPGTPDSSAFTIWSVGLTQLPGSILGTKVVKNTALDVSGAPYFISFDLPVTVQDSFFVAFDLFDYSHHAHQDTIGVLYGPDGSRPLEDRFGRNVIQVHSHGAPVWRDFYSQNFTPISTFLALYPVVEYNTTSVKNAYVQNQQLKMAAPYPNPSNTITTVEYELFSASEVSVSLLTNEGREIKNSISMKYQGIHKEEIPLAELPPGSYLILIRTSHSAMASRITVQ